MAASDRASPDELPQIATSDVQPAVPPVTAAFDSPPVAVSSDGPWLPLVWLIGAFRY